MNSGARFGFIVFLVVSVLAGAWGYYSLRQTRPPSSDPAAVLPGGAVLYLRTSNLRELNTRLNEQSLVAESLRNIAAIDNALSALVDLDSLINSSAELRVLLGNSVFHFAVYPESPYHWLITCRIAKLDDQNRVAAALESISSHRIRLFSGPDGGFSIISGIVAITGHRELLSRLGNSDGLTTTANFRRYAGILNETAPLSIYVDHSRWDSAPALNFMKIQPVAGGGSSYGSLQISPSDMSFAGYFNPNTASNISYLFNTMKFRPIEVVSNLPESIQSLTAVCRGGSADSPGAVNTLGDFWDHATEKAMYDARKTFLSSIGNLVFHFRTTVDYSAVEITDTLQLAELYRAIADSVFNAGSVKVYRMLGDSGTTPALFNVVSNSCRYAAIVNGYSYFSGAAGDMTALIGTIDRKSAGEAGSLRSYVERNVPDSVCLLIYGSPASAAPDSSILKLRSPESSLQLRHACFSLTHRQGFRDDFAFRFHLQHGTALRKTDRLSPGGLWSLNLDTVASGKPALFVNHNTGEKEIIATDVSGKLYLINSKGTVIWKKDLKSRVTGNIVRVDALANGKFQMLFATADHLHLIDRNGNYLPGFPVKLPAALTSPIAVLDYDGKRDYRVYFACADKRIYNYSLNGRLAEGFVPVATADTVRLPVQYIRAGGSDYIIGIDQGGKIYCFSRRGAPRASLKNMSVAHCRGFAVDPGSSAAGTFVYYVDEKAGLLNKISLADKKEIHPLRIQVPINDVLFAKIDGGKLPDVIVRSTDTLSVFDLNGNRLFTTVLKEPAGIGGYFSDGNTGFLYGTGARAFITQMNNGRTVLFASTISPLFTRLFGDNKTYVIHASGNRLTCRLLDRVY